MSKLSYDQRIDIYNERKGDGYSGMDYPSRDKDINFAVIKINCRSPKTGY